jgi:hypothetical protein
MPRFILRNWLRHNKKAKAALRLAWQGSTLANRWHVGCGATGVVPIPSGEQFSHQLAEFAVGVRA